MTRRSDWQSVHEQLMAEDRRLLGEPPTADEVQAYLRGALGPEDDARVRKLLVCYPELARTLTHPFPADDEGEVFSDDELSRHYRELQARVAAPSGQVAPFGAAHVALALAAALAVVFGALLWEARRELARPQLATAEYELLPDQRRGHSGDAKADPIPAANQPVVLMISALGLPEFPSYRLEIVDGEGARLWNRADVRRSENDAFTIVVPRGFLGDGTYRVIVHGVQGTGEERLATYSFRVAARSGTIVP